MARVASGIQPCDCARAFDDRGDGVCVQASGTEVAVTVDLPPERTLGDAGEGQPGAERAHRAGVRV